MHHMVSAVPTTNSSEHNRIISTTHQTRYACAVCAMDYCITCNTRLLMYILQCAAPDDD